MNEMKYLLSIIINDEKAVLLAFFQLQFRVYMQGLPNFNLKVEDDKKLQLKDDTGGTHNIPNPPCMPQISF